MRFDLTGLSMSSLPRNSRPAGPNNVRNSLTGWTNKWGPCKGNVSNVAHGLVSGGRSRGAHSNPRRNKGKKPHSNFTIGGQIPTEKDSCKARETAFPGRFFLQFPLKGGPLSDNKAAPFAREGNSLFPPTGKSTGCALDLLTPLQGLSACLPVCRLGRGEWLMEQGGHNWIPALRLKHSRTSFAGMTGWGGD